MYSRPEGTHFTHESPGMLVLTPQGTVRQQHRVAPWSDENGLFVSASVVQDLLNQQRAPRAGPASHSGPSHRRRVVETALDQMTGPPELTPAGECVTPAGECAVCHEPLVSGADITRLQCAGSHRFHRACIRQWVVQQGHESCPLCRDHFAGGAAGLDAAEAADAARLANAGDDDDDDDDADFFATSGADPEAVRQLMLSLADHPQLRNFARRRKVRRRRRKGGAVAPAPIAEATSTPPEQPSTTATTRRGRRAPSSQPPGTTTHVRSRVRASNLIERAAS